MSTVAVVLRYCILPEGVAVGQLRSSPGLVLGLVLLKSYTTQHCSACSSYIHRTGSSALPTINTSRRQKYVPGI